MFGAPLSANVPQPLYRAKHAGSPGMTVLAWVAVCALVLWAFGSILEVVLLCFVGVLFGLFFYGCGAWLAKRLALPSKPMVLLVALLLVTFVAITVWLAAPAVASQIDDLAATLPRALEQATKPLTRVAWGRSLLENINDPSEFISGRATWSRAGGVISTTLGGFGSVLVVAFIGLFTGYDPHLYRRGLLRLVPQQRRERVNDVLYSTAHTLQMWMVGKLMSMTLIGVGTWIGLAVLGVPLALVLALLAALLTFIPNFGPVLAAIPAILLGLLQGPTLALWVVALYVSLQTLESFVFEPIVQKKMIALPPALTIVAQVIVGSIAGGIGVVVAAPLTAAALVAINELYVRDFLGDE